MEHRPAAAEVDCNVEPQYHDREWWRKKAARCGSDWAGIAKLLSARISHLKRLIADMPACPFCGASPCKNPACCDLCRDIPSEFGEGVDAGHAAPDIVACPTASEDVGGQRGRPGDYWSDPGWRNAARQYHVARAGRLLVTEIEPQRLARLRKLLANDISLDRAWRELNERDDQPAPQVTLDALIYELRLDGLAALEKPNCRRRLADLSDGQLRELIAALIRARTRYAAITDELLITLDGIRR